MTSYKTKKCINRILAELPDNKENHQHKEYIKVKGKDWGCFECNGYDKKCSEYEIQKIK